ncbi:M48 family metalloprotease [Hymenobacter sp. BT186]|uniref:M48 family metalloprotease n=1 Tax=Hymenobacter telluris TaxID=2816474 RepID=A0A939EY96_9BACT|nr:M56 family metallopeptidase [Hymenobacter telluris]MBO0359271.1 M48 family metalloprotease [Hymenobacter telluris]MBW3375297.1 M48 family metalloprotease [Hymenobacter norwichensis]
MSLLEHYGSPALLRALGWTLLHSVWQGALVALTAATLLMLLHRHAAALRYRVAAGAMLLLLVLSGLTFGYYYTSFQAAGSNSLAETGATVWSATAPADVVPVPETGVVLHDGDGTTFTDVLTPLEEPSRLQQLLQTSKTYLERNMPVVVVAWLLGMLAMTLRFLGGLAYVQRLRRYRVAALPAEWQTRLDALAARTNLRRPVQILASGLVPGPLVIGWLKPVVLLPMSAASGLSGSELEAILAHELAHVMRRDYLFNLLQSVAEILFFYHPAVWFLSGCLRTERENCCDDIATELCGDSLVLAQALASLAALQHAQSTFTPRLAMAAAGQEGSLLSRVRRLVQHRAAAPTFSDGFWAACVVLLSVGLLTVTTVLSLSAASFSTPSSAATAEHDAVMPTEAEAAKEIVLEALSKVPDHGDYEPGDSQLLDDTVVVYAQSNPKLLTKSGKAKLNEIKGLTVVVKDESGAISEVYVDGKKVPAAELPAYREALAKTEEVKRATKAQSAIAQDQQERMTVLSNRMAAAALSGNSPSAADAEELSKLAMSTARLSVSMSQLNGDMKEMEKSFRIAEKTLTDELSQKNLSEEKVEQLRESLQELREQHIEQIDEIRRAEEQNRLDEEQDRRDEDQARRDEQQARRDADQARRDVEQARRDKEQAKRDKEQAAWHKALVGELAKDGLIRDPNNYSVSLSQKSFSVDGKKQSDALRDKYLKLYESRTGRKMSATGSMNLVEQRDSNSTVAYNDMPPAPPAPPAPGTPMAPSLPRVPRTPSVPRAPSALRAPLAPRPPRAPEDRSERVREALWQDGLLDKSEKSFSLQLNSKGLTVNGKQQSATLADKYRKLLGASEAQNSKSTINITVSE